MAPRDYLLHTSTTVSEASIQIQAVGVPSGARLMDGQSLESNVAVTRILIGTNEPVASGLTALQAVAVDELLADDCSFEKCLDTEHPLGLLAWLTPDDEETSEEAEVLSVIPFELLYPED